MCILPHPAHWKGNERRFFAVGAAVALSPSFGACSSFMSIFRAAAVLAASPVETPRVNIDDNAPFVTPIRAANSVRVRPLAFTIALNAFFSLFICSCVFIDYQVFAAKITNIFLFSKILLL